MKITVNGQVIPPQHIQQEVQRYRQQNLGTNEKEAFDSVSQTMIEWTLIRQAAAEKDIAVTPEEIEKGFEQLCQSHGGKEQFFQRFGLTEDNLDEVKNDVERQQKVSKFLDDLAKDVAKPSEAAIAAYYETHKQQFMHPEKVHAAHIVKHPQGEAAEQQAAAELTAARQRILDGEDFLKVADEVSECNDTTPDLGEFARGKMVPEFELVAFSMNVGEVSPVFKSPFGLHVATVFSKTGAQPMSLEESRVRIQDMLFYELRNDAIGNWVGAEKKKADILVQMD